MQCIITINKHYNKNAVYIIYNVLKDTPISLLSSDRPSLLFQCLFEPIWTYTNTVGDNSTLEILLCVKKSSLQTLTSHWLYTLWSSK